MNKELQDIAWKVLPKEFKTHVKWVYEGSIEVDEYNEGYNTALEGLFGIHNLTSDVEEEEMLIISRREIQQLVVANDIVILKAAGIDNIETIQAKTVNTILNRLFGSKCLPDELNEDNFAKSEPIYHIGQKVVYKKNGTIKTITGIDSVSDETGTSYYYDTVDAHGNSRLQFLENELYPYEEPKDESPVIIDCDKCSEQGKCDMLIKRVLPAQKRLQIAAMAMQGLLASPVDANMQSKSVDYITDASFEYADALISKSKKGGLNENN